ncbi:MAG: hypothetical protein IBJ00_08055, partial [Alphaproteobacteria bacterium]|nr:hypothetical protein [Alphaproteobacteria bacterium]
LQTGQKSVLESPKRLEEIKVSYEKMTEMSVLGNIASDYYYERCSQVAGRKMSVTTDFQECEELGGNDKKTQENFCKNYFSGLINYYKDGHLNSHISTNQLEERTIQLLKERDFERVKQAFIEMFTYGKDNPCNIISH